VQIGGASVQELLNELGESSTGSPVLAERLDLIGSGNFASEEKPENSFWEGLRSTRGLGEYITDFRNGLAAEADTFLGVEDGAFPEEGGETTHTTINDLIMSSM